MNEIQYIQKHGAKNARYPAYNNLDEKLEADGFTGDIQALKRIISACELVELAGGYEEAKTAFAEMLNADKQYPNEKENNERILLDYRRANNIFEVGDYYAYLYEWDSDLDIVCKFNPSEWSDHLWHIKNMIRHATDEEIKANRRLDQ